MTFILALLVASVVLIWTPLAALVWVLGYASASFTVVIALGGAVVLLERTWLAVDAHLLPPSTPLYARLACAAVYGVGVGLTAAAGAVAFC